MKEAIDFLEELSDDENVTYVPEGIYLEPPEYEDYASGEDDGKEDEGGVPDDVCAEQLKAPCEIVMSNGHRIDGSDPNEFDNFAKGFY